MSKLDELRGVVSDEILVRAIESSKRLSNLGVPHMLIGGLAVGVHGYPRTTKDVDFMVGPEAFKDSPILVYRDELVDIARAGFTDLNPPGRFPLLDQELSTDSMGVVSLNGLLLMKLDAWRPQDQRDIVMLLRLHPDCVDGAVRYLRQAIEDPQLRADLLSKFLELAQD